MWPAHPSDRSYEAERSLGTNSLPVKHWCSSRSPIALMPRASAGRRRSVLLRISGCPDWACESRSACSSRSASSRSSTRAARAGLLDIGSLSRPTYGQLCNPYLRTVTGNYRARRAVSVMGNCVATKVVTTRVTRSTVALRALPGALRSLRSLCSILIAPGGIHGGGHRLRWSFPPAGGGGGRDPEAVASYRLTTQRARDSRLMMDRCQHGRFRRPADGPAGALVVAAAQPSHTTRASNRHPLPVGRFADTVSGGAS